MSDLPKVGVEFESNYSALQAADKKYFTSLEKQTKSTADFIKKQFGGIGSTIQTQLVGGQTAATQLGNMAKKSADEAVQHQRRAHQQIKQSTQQSTGDTVKLHTQALQKIRDTEAVNQRFIQQLHEKTTVKLVDNLFKYQQKKAAIDQLIKVETDKNLKATERDFSNHLLRINNLYATELKKRPEVTRGGAAAKDSIYGIGREILTTIGGGGSAFAFSDIANIKRELAPVKSMMIDTAKATGGLDGKLLILATKTLPLVGTAAGLMAVALGAALKEGMPFETASLHLKSQVGLATNDLKEINREALEFSQRFHVEAPEAEDVFRGSLVEFGREVLKDKDSLISITNSVGLLTKAIGPDGDAKASLELISTTMNQFGLNTGTAADKAKNAKQVVEVLAAASRESLSDINGLAQGMAGAGNVAEQFDLNIQETASAVIVLNRNGLQMGETGAALKEFLEKTASGSKEQRDALKQLGLTYHEINVENVGLSNSLSVLGDRLEKIKDPYEKARILQTLFGERAGVVSKLLIDNRKQIDNLAKSLNGQTVAEQMAADNMKSLDERIKGLKIGAENLAIKLYDRLGPAFDATSKYIHRSVKEAEDLYNLIVKLTGGKVETSFVGSGGEFGHSGTALDWSDNAIAATTGNKKSKKFFKGDESTPDERKKAADEAFQKQEDALKDHMAKELALYIQAGHTDADIKTKQLSLEEKFQKELLDLAVKYKQKTGEVNLAFALKQVEVQKDISDRIAAFAKTAEDTVAQSALHQAMTIDLLLAHRIISERSAEQQRYDIQKKALDAQIFVALFTYQNTSELYQKLEQLQHEHAIHIANNQQEDLKNLREFEKKKKQIEFDIENQDLLTSPDGLEKTLAIEELKHKHQLDELKSFLDDQLALIIDNEEEKKRVQSLYNDQVRLENKRHDDTVQKDKEDYYTTQTFYTAAFIDTLKSIETSGLEFIENAWYKSWNDQKSFLLKATQSIVGIVNNFLIKSLDEVEQKAARKLVDLLLPDKKKDVDTSDPNRDATGAPIGALNITTKALLDFSEALTTARTQVLGSVPPVAGSQPSNWKMPAMPDKFGNYPINEAALERDDFGNVVQTQLPLQGGVGPFVMIPEGPTRKPTTQNLQVNEYYRRLRKTDPNLMNDSDSKKYQEQSERIGGVPDMLEKAVFTSGIAGVSMLGSAAIPTLLSGSLPEAGLLGNGLVRAGIGHAASNGLFAGAGQLPGVDKATLDIASQVSDMSDLSSTLISHGIKKFIEEGAIKAGVNFGKDAAFNTTVSGNNDFTGNPENQVGIPADVRAQQEEYERRKKQQQAIMQSSLAQTQDDSSSGSTPSTPNAPTAPTDSKDVQKAIGYAAAGLSTLGSALADSKKGNKKGVIKDLLVGGASIAANAILPGSGVLISALGGLFADGGHVIGPGGPKDDMIPARLSAGEYVLTASATKAIGVGALDHINRRFANGGVATLPNVTRNSLQFAHLPDVMVPSHSISGGGSSSNTEVVRAVRSLESTVKNTDYGSTYDSFGAKISERKTQNFRKARRG